MVRKTRRFNSKELGKKAFRQAISEMGGINSFRRWKIENYQDILSEHDEEVEQDIEIPMLNKSKKCFKHLPEYKNLTPEQRAKVLEWMEDQGGVANLIYDIPITIH